MAEPAHVATSGTGDLPTTASATPRPSITSTDETVTPYETLGLTTAVVVGVLGNQMGQSVLKLYGAEADGVRQPTSANGATPQPDERVVPAGRRS